MGLDEHGQGADAARHQAAVGLNADRLSVFLMTPP